MQSRKKKIQQVQGMIGLLEQLEDVVVVGPVNADHHET